MSRGFWGLAINQLTPQSPQAYCEIPSSYFEGATWYKPVIIKSVPTCAKSEDLIQFNKQKINKTPMSKKFK